MPSSSAPTRPVATTASSAGSGTRRPWLARSLSASWMNVASMGGFSDSHEGIDIPLIAANTQRMIPMRQNQIWAVLRKQDSLNRLRYSLAATFLGRMCLSGDIHDLSAEQLAVVEEATAFYQTIKDSIRTGTSYRHGEAPLSYQKPRGYQAVTRVHTNGKDAFCVIHTFADCPTTLTIPLQADWTIAGAFSDSAIEAMVERQSLTINKLKPFTGLVIRLSE